MPDITDDELDPLVLNLEALLDLEVQSFAVTLRKEIATMRLGGMADEAIYQTLLADAEQGGRIFGQFSNAVKSQLYGATTEASRLGKEKVFEESGIDMTNERWMTVSKSPCPDCDSRAGRIETHDYWETVGLPKSGFSVCGNNCQCQLVPVDSNAPDEVRLE